MRVLSTLIGAAAPETEASVRDAAEHATMLLDIGRSVNYYDRWMHSATIVSLADLRGFSHRDIALIATVLARMGRGRSTLPRYARLLAPADLPQVDRVAILLELADELEHRLPQRAAATARADQRRQRVVLSAPLDYLWNPEDLARRFRRRFGNALVFRPSR